VKKLTLSMDEETIAEAKRLAAESGTSVSAMFARLVRAMANRHGEEPYISPTVRSISGIVSLPEGKSDKELLTEALMDKYGEGL
jgi:hypothetical protein